MDTRKLWTFRALFVVLGLAFVFLKLLPLGAFGGRVPGPDLLTALVVAWVLRRPDYVPVGLVFLVGLLTDALLNKPLGLWTLILLLMAEVLRRTVHQTVRLTPSAEAGVVIPALLCAYLAERVMMVLLVADPAPLGAQVLHVAITLAFYPVVVFATHALFGVRRLQPGELDSLGTRA